MTKLEEAIKTLVTVAKEEGKAEARAELLKSLGGGTVAKKPAAAKKPAPAKAPKAVAAKKPAPAKKRVRVTTDVKVGDVIDYITNHPACKAADIRTKFNLTEGQFQRFIKAGKSSGKIQMIGVRRDAAYYPVNAAAE